MVDPEVFYRIYTVYDTFITLCIPVMIIFSLNSYVLIRLLQNLYRRRSKFYKRRNALSTAVRSKKTPDIVEMTDVVPYQHRDSVVVTPQSAEDSLNLIHTIFRWKLVVRPNLVAHRHATRLIMTKSAMFLGFNFPIYIYRVWMLVRRVNIDEDEGVAQRAPTLFHVAICIYYAQCALNICIYFGEWVYQKLKK